MTDVALGLVADAKALSSSPLPDTLGNRGNHNSENDGPVNLVAPDKMWSQQGRPPQTQLRLNLLTA